MKKPVILFVHFVAFSRAGGRLFVIVTFGTTDIRQDLGWLGLPAGTYKEIFNSSWDEYQLEWEPSSSNGRYTAQLRRGSVVNLPAIGAVVLERY